jgi:pimeloyl-ACP methyl ester carboxylesterase
MSSGAIVDAGVTSMADGRLQNVGVRPERLHLQACDVPGVGSGRCGTYDVFENRLARRGRTIGLTLIVLPASTTRAKDPVFWLEGGPGGAATQAIGPVSQQYLRGLRDDHDLVFVDQRGTGSSNPLKCDDIGETPTDLDAYFGKLFPLPLIRACRDTLRRRADLTLYTTPIAMDDLDDVREALGYQRINLAAASYGTLAAQVYIRQHPTRVRSAFLVGVVTPRFRLPLPFAQAAQNALDRLFDDCMADRVCHGAFPNLKDEFDKVLARFGRGPLQIAIMDPASQHERSVMLERESYVEHVRALLYSTITARFVPLIVHQAFLNDFVPFGIMATRVNLGGPTTARGLYFSVTCAEATPYITEQAIVDDTRGTFLGDRRVRAHIDACKEWPAGAVPKGFLDPLKSPIPIVMFSGDADGSTPPWIGKAAVKFLPHGRQIEAPHTGHQIDGPCTWDLMQAFFRTAAPMTLDASCVESARRPPFALELPRR